MLKRGPRVFHVNREDDLPKLTNWLRRGPSYVDARVDPATPRQIRLFGSWTNTEHQQQIGVVIVMSKSFTATEVMQEVEKWIR